MKECLSLVSLCLKTTGHRMQIGTQRARSVGRMNGEIDREKSADSREENKRKSPLSFEYSRDRERGFSSRIVADLSSPLSLSARLSSVSRAFPHFLFIPGVRSVNGMITCLDLIRDNSISLDDGTVGFPLLSPRFQSFFLSPIVSLFHAFVHCLSLVLLDTQRKREDLVSPPPRNSLSKDCSVRACFVLLLAPRSL